MTGRSHQHHARRVSNENDRSSPTHRRRQSSGQSSGERRRAPRTSVGSMRQRYVTRQRNRGGSAAAPLSLSLSTSRSPSPSAALSFPSYLKRPVYQGVTEEAILAINPLAGGGEVSLNEILSGFEERGPE